MKELTKNDPGSVIFLSIILGAIFLTALGMVCDTIVKVAA